MFPPAVCFSFALMKILKPSPDGLISVYELNNLTISSASWVSSPLWKQWSTSIATNGSCSVRTKPIPISFLAWLSASSYETKCSGLLIWAKRGFPFSKRMGGFVICWFLPLR